jgi:hypothetical protein
MASSSKKFSHFHRSLKQRTDDTSYISHWTFLLPVLQALDTVPAHFLRHISPRYEQLLIAHSLENINVFDRNVEFAMARVLPPGVRFPYAVEEDNERKSNVCTEEGFCIGGAADWLPHVSERNDDGIQGGTSEEIVGITYPKRGVELSDQAENVHNYADIASDNTELRSIRYFRNVVAMVLPSLSESNMSYADTAIDEEIGDTGKSKQPIEDDAACR